MLVFLLFFVFYIRSDIPVHCVWPQVKGTWKFHLTANSYDKSVVDQCPYAKSLPYPEEKNIRITLEAPDVAINEDTKSKGFFTLIYDEDLFIEIDNQRFLVFFKYERSGSNVRSNCNETFTGWFHDTKTDPDKFPENWGCFYGHKEDNSPSDIHIYQHQEKQFEIPSQEYIDKLNSAGLTWKAKKYPDEHYKKLFSVFRGTKPGFNKPSNVNSNVKLGLPDNFDWRDKEGKNYVTKVHDQGAIGSCYAWSSTGMYESRARVQSELRFKPEYDTNEIIYNSQYNQKGDGGFPMAVSLWVEDFSVSYTNEKSSFVKNSEYIGGYYGASSENLMLDELYNNGPISVCFFVYNDFFSYSSGIYWHKGEDGPEPKWEETNQYVICILILLVLFLLLDTG